MGPFNNREIATVFWLVVVFAWTLRKSHMLQPLAGIVQSFARPKVLTAVSLMLVYTAGAVALLGIVGFWTLDLLKDTILWFCISAMAMMIRVGASSEAANILRKVVVDNVRIVIGLEFLINTYTFSLPVEFAFIPIVSLIAGLAFVAHANEKYPAVARLTGALQPTIGFVVLVIAVGSAIADAQALNSLDTIRSIALAPTLSIILIPFLYVLALISQYERAFQELKLGTEKRKSLKRYARRRILMYGKFNLRRAQQLNNHGVKFRRIQTKEDVDHLLGTGQRL